MSNEGPLESFLTEFNGRTWSIAGTPDYVTPHSFFQPLEGGRLDVVYATATRRPSASDVRSLWEKRWNRRPSGSC